MRLRLPLVIAMMFVACAAEAAALALPASSLLPPEHWAVKAAGRLEEMGLLQRWMPAQRAVPLLVVARALDEADRALRAAPPLELTPAQIAIVGAWCSRFDREWPGARDEARRASRPPALRPLGAALAAGYRGGSATEVTGAAVATGASALHLEAPADDPFAEASGAAGWGAHLAAGGRLIATPTEAHLDRADLVAAAGAWALAVGRGAIGYGPNDFGAVVMRGSTALDRIELMTTAPVRFPGTLDFLGDFAVDLALARLDEPRHPYGALLLTTQLQWRPHPRFTLSALRGYMFGGSLWDGISIHDAVLGLLGPGNYMGNNVMSSALRYRLPSEAWLPLTFKLEWGTDDNPGALFSWPGLVMGLSAPMLPGLPASLVVEAAYFGHGTRMFAHDPFAWYSHFQYYGGWSTGQTPLGDPLGGNGRALRVIAAADPLGGQLRLSAAGWLQERFIDNNYAHGASGGSVGAEGEAEWRWDAWSLGVRGTYEHGSEGWARREVSVRGARTF